MKVSSVPGVLATLGVLVVLRDANGSFRIQGSPPVWFLRLFGAADADHGDFPLTERFPFLESFLPTAENFWASRGQGRIRSGYWVESLAGGAEVPLQASAATVDGQDLLLIESVKGIYEQERGLLQKARDHSLAREESDRLQRELRVEKARHRVLLGALEGLVLRLDGGGRVLEAHPAPAGKPPEHIHQMVPQNVAEEVLQCGRKSLATGRMREIGGVGGYSGRVASISRDEFWALLRPPRAD